MNQVENDLLSELNGSQDLELDLIMMVCNH